jgi:hypothetical protein
MFLNGVSQGTSTLTLFNNNCGSSCEFIVGGRIAGYLSGDSFNGTIDDVRLYNRTFTSAEVQNLYNNIYFSRYFYIDNVTRDSGGSIASGNDDPATQKITAYTDWAGQGTAVSQVKALDYITRWQNENFAQTDWSGGSGNTSVITQPKNDYTSSSNIDATSTYGSIKIFGL